MLAALALLLGHIAGVLAVAPPGRGWAVLAITTALIAMVVGRDRLGVRVMAAALLGFALASEAARDWLERRWPLEAHDERVIVEGEIVTVPTRRGGDVTFDARVRVREPSTLAGDVPLTLRIVWRGAPREVHAHSAWRWLLRARAYPSRASALDLERAWLRDGVHGEGAVVPSPLNQRLAVAPSSIDAARERITRAIQRHVADRDAGALIAALAVGFTGDVSSDQWRVFNATGTTHLVAISGMHVTLFAAVAFFAARRAWGRLPERWRTVDREACALAVGVAASFGYALLAGFSVPTQRTVAMLGTYALARILQRDASWTQTLALALLVVLLIDPMAPLAPGFWLSFVAVVAILLAASGRAPRISTWTAVLVTQVAVAVALLPISAAMFGATSIASLAVNVVAIPAISFLLVPCVLLATVAELSWPGAGGPLWRIAEWFYLVGWPWLVAAADWPHALWRLEPAPSWFVLAGLAAAAALLPWPLRLRVASAVALLPLLSPVDRGVPHGEARVAIISAGQGTAAVIATKAHTIVYDTGDSWGSRGLHAETLLRPRLLAAGRDRIAWWVLPRVTQDRAAGVGRIAASFEIDRLRGGGPWLGALARYEPCRSNAAAEFDGVRFEQWVAADRSGREYCALTVATRGARLMLAGDLNREAEIALVDAARKRAVTLASDVVLVPRRGSAAASSQAWIDAVAPRIAVVTGARADRATSPRAQVLRRWAMSGATVVETQATGMVDIALTNTPSATVVTNSLTKYPFLWRSMR